MDDWDDKFKKNEYSWNREANMLYIESPAGVGYSYCENSRLCSSSDASSSLDNLDALLAFFEKFPKFLTNDLYLSGESYAGIYVPYLALRITQYNNLVNDAQPLVAESSHFETFDTPFTKRFLSDTTNHQSKTLSDTKNHTVLNLKGFMVGNPLTDLRMDGDPSYLKMAHFFSLIGPEFQKAVEVNKCNFDFMHVQSSLSNECKLLVKEFRKATACINVYDVYRRPEKCNETSGNSEVAQKLQESANDDEYGESMVGG